jgi:dTDP-4-dehydrorhamnose reductase
MASILVTGATGLLGSSLVPALRAAGHAVHSHGHSHAAEQEADLGDWTQTAALLERTRPDCIVNLAALTNVDLCEADPQQAYRLNTLPVAHLARWMREQAGEQAPACHLVQISTDMVYDGSGPHAEGDVRVANTYAFSKLAAEHAAAGVSSTVLRTNFFGRSRRAGRVSFSDWLVQGMREGRAMTVFDDVLFSPLAIDTLCSLLAQVVQARPRGVYNLGARDGMSKADFAYQLAAALDLPTGALQRGLASAAPALRARRPTDMRTDCSLFEHTMGLRLPTLAEQIQSLRSDYLEPA